MIRILPWGLGLLSFAGAAIAACDYANLAETAEKYDFLMSTGDHSLFDNLSYDLVYKENDKDASFLLGIAALGLYISANRTFYDTTLCKFITEHVVTNPEHPYIIQTQTYVKNGIVEVFDILVTDEGDFNFNATGYKEQVYSQKWDLIPENKRDTRQVLQAAADAYLDHLHDRTLPFPVGPTCSVVTGGVYLKRNGTVTDSCTHQPPKPIQTITNRRYVIDEVCNLQRSL